MISVDDAIHFSYHSPRGAAGEGEGVKIIIRNCKDSLESLYDDEGNEREYIKRNAEGRSEKNVRPSGFR